MTGLSSVESAGGVPDIPVPQLCKFRYNLTFISNRKDVSLKTGFDPMNCRAANQLYVRANGSVPCNCDVGEGITLFTPDLEDKSKFSYVRDCYNGEPFVRLRESFAEGRAFLDCCRNCFFFEPSGEFPHFGEEGRLREMAQVQIESSFLCTVDCEACVEKSIRTDPDKSPLGTGPYNIPVDLFKKLIDDLTEAGIIPVDFLFCGRGEPLLHPSFTELITYAKSTFPRSVYAVHTNGNLKFFPGVLELDFLIVSIDGAYQDSYERYRRGGDLKRVFRFIEDVLKSRNYPHRSASFYPVRSRTAKLLGKRKRPLVRWKYILFEHNDSEGEIREAQRLALEIGVDELQFVLSHTWNRSRKYTSLEQIESDPLFHLFKRGRHFYSCVSDDVENIAQWEDEGRRRGRK